MDNGWTPGKAPRDPKMSPYVHWWETKERNFLPQDIQDDLARVFLDIRESLPVGDVGKGVEGSFFAQGNALPLSAEVANPLKPTERPKWLASQIADRLPDNVPEDTVITGILDTGIGLSHMTTNIAAGRTRVISSWQQGAAMLWEDASESGGDSSHRTPVEKWLPCGREVFHDEINDALARYGNPEGVVEEVDFNRALELSAPDAVRGNRDLELAAAHGTHTLSLAAGYDPERFDEDVLTRQRIIAVNLPAQYHHGSAGNFLAYFAVYGVERILHVADALWEKNTETPNETGIVRGYPIVINFSYGMTGGSKDGQHIFERALSDIIDLRMERARAKQQDASPVRIMMPVGNENLAQGAASIILGAKGTTVGKDGAIEALQSMHLPWRIMPDDKTANFLEIWSEEKSKTDFDNLVEKAKVFVTPPGRDRLQLAAFEDGTFQDLGNFARVYCQFATIDRGVGPAVMETADGGSTTDVKYRLALLVCIAPTTTEKPDAPCAPAGAWTVEVEYEGEEAVDFTFYIQTDQSAVVTSETGLRSYIDHPSYRTHLTEHPSGHESESGAYADTFSFDVEDPPVDNDDWEKFGPVQRRGSHNALSSLSRPEVIAVGSFDDFNGYPTVYSATTDGNPQLDYTEVVGRERNLGREILTVCYPGENAPSLFGVLGSGARDGSVIGARGTSMSTALATREASVAFLSADQANWSKVGTQNWFREKAEVVDAADKTDVWGQDLRWPIPGDQGRLKMGWGRLPDPRFEAVKRLGEESWDWHPSPAPVPAAE